MRGRKHAASETESNHYLQILTKGWPPGNLAMNHKGGLTNVSVEQGLSAFIMGMGKGLTRRQGASAIITVVRNSNSIH